MTDLLWSLGAVALSGAGIFAVLRSKVETHHRVIFDQNGVIQFPSRADCEKRRKDDLIRCKEKHAEEITKICLKIELIRTEIRTHTDMVAAQKEVLERLLDRITVADGRRSIDG